MKTAALAPRQMAVIVVLGFITGFATSALGAQAWIVMPSALFVGFLGAAILFRRQALTVQFVLVLTGVSLALAAFLKLF